MVTAWAEAPVAAGLVEAAATGRAVAYPAWRTIPGLEVSKMTLGASRMTLAI